MTSGPTGPGEDPDVAPGGNRAEGPLRESWGTARPVPRTQQLCQTLSRALGMDGAAVAMITDGGERDLVHATDPVISHLDELQFTLAEGPCLDAHASRAPVLVGDLSSADSMRRWPVFAQEAVKAGASAAFAFPMIARTVCFGVLELYRREPGDVDEVAIEQVADSLESLTQVALDELLGAAPTPESPHSWPGQLTAEHAHVHQAAGLVAVQLGVSVPDAMARMRAAAYSRRATLAELADELLTGRTRLEKDMT